MSSQVDSREPGFDPGGPRPTASDLYEAETWFQRFQSGQLDRASALRLLDWLERDPRHVKAFKSVAEGKGDRGVGEVLHHIDQANQGPTLVAPRRPRRWPKVLGVLAGLLIGAALGFVIQQDETLVSYPKRLLADYATGSGQTRSVLLDDGGELLLGSETAVNLRFETSERFVDFLGGEALFTVGGGDNRPFIVQSPTVILEAIGTRFALRDVGGQAVVSVEEGAVRVEPRTRPGHGILVRAGSEVKVAETVGPPQPLGHYGAQAWRNGRLPPRVWTLSALVAEYRRYTPGAIVVLASLDAADEVSGSFQSDEAAEALGEVGEFWGLEILSLLEGRILILYRNPGE